MDSTQSSLYSDPLVLSCFAQNSVTLYNRIQQSFDVNQQDSNKRTPLHAAAYVGNADCCQTLIDAGAIVNTKDNQWITPLHWACASGNEGCVEILLDHSADAGSRDKNYQTPIHVAASHGHETICGRLVGAGASVGLPDRQGRTPLHLAAYSGHADVVKFMLNKKAKYGHVDRGGRTALHWAAFGGQDAVVQVFIDARIIENYNVTDRTGCTPLHAAAANGCLSVIESLLKEGAQANVRDNKGRTPLHYAASGGYDSCIELLATKSENINVVDNRGQTPLHKAALIGDHSAVLVILENGGDPKLVDSKGRSPLHLSINRGDLDCVDLLLKESGENKTAVDNKNNNLVHYAAIYGHLHLLHLFGLYNISLTTKGQRGMTALHLAALHGKDNCLRFLADKEDANLDAVDDDGRRPIHAAAFKGQYDSVQYLIMKKADCDVKDQFKRTPLHYAAAASSSSVCNLISQTLDAKAKDHADVLGRSALHYAAATDVETVEYFMHEHNGQMQGDLNLMTPVHLAAWFGHKRSIDVMLAKLHDAAAVANQTDNNDRSALHFAACAGHPDAVECLTQLDGIQVNVKDVLGRTPLDAAAFRGHPECIELLLERGAELNATDNNGRTALMAAAHMGMEEAVDVLLGDEDESETNVEQVDSAGRNALMLASMAGSDDCIIGIVRHGGTNINAKDKMGLTAMHHAVCSVKTEDDTSVIKEVLEALVNHGSELTACDNDGRSIAHFAAIVGCDDILRGVADKFPVNQLDVYGHTPMHYACYHGRDNCVSVLVDDEVVMYNEFESPFGAFHCAAYRGNADCLETIFSEVDDELSLARVKSVDAQGMNPLHYAAARGHVECVKIMLSTDEAEDLDVKTADGQTPLNLAAKNGHHGACGDLVESGCELNLPESGDTFLHQLYNQAPIPQMDSNTGTVEEDTATAYTVLESVFYRLEDEPEERDVITSAEDTQGRTILHLAAKNHDQQSVELLLQDKGRVADQLDKKDSDGLTPLHHLIGTNNGRKCLDIILDVLDNKRAESAMSP